MRNIDIDTVSISNEIALCVCSHSLDHSVSGVDMQAFTAVAKALRNRHEFRSETRQSVISDEIAFDLDLDLDLDLRGPLVAAGFAD